MAKKKNIRRKGIGALVLFAASLLLLLLANTADGFSDAYVKYIYSTVVNLWGRFFGIFPFSVSELCIYAALAFVLVFSVKLILKKDIDKSYMLNVGASIVLAASIIFFVYTANCGANYHKTDFSESSGIRTVAYTVSELVDVCQSLTEDVNYWSSRVERDDNGIAMLEDDGRAEAVDAMEHIARQYPELEGYYPKPKKLLLSQLLSYQGLSGIYLPFTIEANYNGDMVPYNIPFTMCHELSHLRGFMQEEEANFIAYLACEQSDRSDFQYSASLMAWIYASNQLYKNDPDEYELMRAGLSKQARADLKANAMFWDTYEGTVSEIADKVNDTYLKANGQQDGVNSYDRMVDLLVAYKLKKEG